MEDVGQSINTVLPDPNSNWMLAYTCISPHRDPDHASDSPHSRVHLQTCLNKFEQQYNNLDLDSTQDAVELGETIEREMAEVALLKAFQVDPAINVIISTNGVRIKYMADWLETAYGNSSTASKFFLFDMFTIQPTTMAALERGSVVGSLDTADAEPYGPYVDGYLKAIYSWTKALSSSLLL